jgi:hypothetical protein
LRRARHGINSYKKERNFYGSNLVEEHFQSYILLIEEEKIIKWRIFKVSNAQQKVLEIKDCKSKNLILKFP